MAGNGNAPQSNLVHPPIKYHGNAGMGAVKSFTCKLCGSEWPLEIGDSAETCEQWAALVAKKMPKPCPLAATVELKSLGKLCSVSVQLKGVMHGLEAVLDRTTILSDLITAHQRQ